MWPGYLWLSEVLPEAETSKVDRPTDGMRENRVHESKVLMGVKFLAPVSKSRNNDINPANLDISDFITGPGRLR